MSHIFQKHFYKNIRSNYVKKADLKAATGIDTSKLRSKTDLVGMKN